MRKEAAENTEQLRTHQRNEWFTGVTQLQAGSTVRKNALLPNICSVNYPNRDHADKAVISPVSQNTPKQSAVS